MKKFLTVILSTAIILSGCAVSSKDETSSDGGETQTEAPAQAELPENLESMREPIDALLMCSIDHEDFEYDVNNSYDFWLSLYYFAGLYGPKHILADYNDGVLKLMHPTVQEFASVLYADYNDLLELPEDMKDKVEYDADYDSYTFYTGDRGLCYTAITGCTDNEDGTYTITAQLLDTVDNSLIGSGTFVLTENKYISGIVDARYMYSISSFERS